MTINCAEKGNTGNSELLLLNHRSAVAYRPSGRSSTDRYLHRPHRYRRSCNPLLRLPHHFQSFLLCALPLNSQYSVHAFKSVYDFSLETGTAVVPHINDIFVAGTIRASTYDDLLLGVHLVNSTFFDALPALYAAVPPSRISNVELDWQPIGSLWLSASASNGVRGNPLGLEEGDGTYIAWAEVIEWFDNSDDVFVNAWIQNITTAINDAAKAAGLFDPFLYMGDAAGFQDVFAGYGRRAWRS